MQPPPTTKSAMQSLIRGGRMCGQRIDFLHADTILFVVGEKILFVGRNNHICWRDNHICWRDNHICGSTQVPWFSSTWQICPGGSVASITVIIQPVGNTLSRTQRLISCLFAVATSASVVNKYYYRILQLYLIFVKKL